MKHITNRCCLARQSMATMASPACSHPLGLFTGSRVSRSSHPRAAPPGPPCSSGKSSWASPSTGCWSRAAISSGSPSRAACSSGMSSWAPGQRAARLGLPSPWAAPPGPPALQASPPRPQEVMSPSPCPLEARPGPPAPRAAHSAQDEAAPEHRGVEEQEAAPQLLLQVPRLQEGVIHTNAHISDPSMLMEVPGHGSP
jgi:hypothetical protein